MPIEIRELVIRAEVEPQQGQESGQGAGSASEREQLVRDCVEQVMEIIRQKEER
ncbi:MAG: hypothetical protein KQH63_11470 [Desulfobulbaceae bacterium]|nr:hypothetical protein [Desulfobulbaceae bacterium]